MALLVGLWLQPATSRAEAGRLVEMDFRLVMAAMAQRVGANGQIALYRAQEGAEPQALAVVGGRLELGVSGAAAPLPRSGRLVRQADGALLARAPIVVWEGAELVLGSGTDLHLSRDDGAFLVSFGQLDLDGARISGTGGAPAGSEAFRPFVLVAGTGALTARNSEFAALGFDGAPAFAGVAVVNRGIFPAMRPSLIEHSRFEAIGGLVLDAVDGATLAQNRIEGAGAAAIWLRRARDLRVTGNRIGQPAGHGIRLSAGARQVQLLDNEIVGAGGAGIFADSGSADLLIEGNRIAGSKSDAISLKQVNCVSVRNNAAIAAGGSGIRLRQSEAVEVRGNRLSQGAGAGVSLLDQPPGAETLLEGNLLDGNAIGLAGANAAGLRLLGNDLTGQFPRLLDGDLVYRARDLLRDLRGREPLSLAAPAAPAARAAPTCLIGQGA